MSQLSVDNPPPYLDRPTTPAIQPIAATKVKDIPQNFGRCGRN